MKNSAAAAHLAVAAPSSINSKTMLADLSRELLYCWASPFVAVWLLLEMVWSQLENRPAFDPKDTAHSLVFGLASLLLEAATMGIALLALAACFEHRLFDWPPTAAGGWVYWLAAVMLADLAYYACHCLEHRSRLFWASHLTHHSSERFNLTTGFRATLFKAFYRYWFLLPLAVLGFRPLDVLFAYSLGTVYGLFIHTQRVGKLGWLEWIFVTPAHHRVHHACNVIYLDRNMGGIFICWDRLFGTFQEEKTDEPVRFGLTKKTDDPTLFHLAFSEWKDLLADLRRPGLSWKNRLNYLLRAPGWSHDNSRKTTQMLQAEYGKT